MELADQALGCFDEDDVLAVKSHYVCHILLNSAAYYYIKLRKVGLVTEREAGECLEEIEEYVFDTLQCAETEHDEEVDTVEKFRRISVIPKSVRDFSAMASMTDVKNVLGLTKKKADMEEKASIEDDEDVVISAVEVENMNAEMPPDVDV